MFRRFFFAVLASHIAAQLPPKVPVGPGQAIIRRDGDVLTVTIAVQHRGIASLLLASKDHLWVLHASAALGTGVYRRHENRWQVDRAFDYQCREVADATCREAYRAKEGWVANTAPRGADRTFTIDLPRFDSPLRMAITYLVLEPVTPYAWPIGDGAAASLKLQQGWLPEVLQADTDGWIEVNR